MSIDINARTLHESSAKVLWGRIWVFTLIIWLTWKHVFFSTVKVTNLCSSPVPRPRATIQNLPTWHSLRMKRERFLRRYLCAAKTKSDKVNCIALELTDRTSQPSTGKCCKVQLFIRVAYSKLTVIQLWKAMKQYQFL